MDADANETASLVCVKCGVSKPIMVFDQRFVGKTLNLTCSECRGIPNESSKWRDLWASYKGTEEWRRDLAAEAVARQKAKEWVRHQAERERTEERSRKLAAASQRKRQLFSIYLLGRGFDDTDIAHIYCVHDDIRHARQPWQDLKRQYAALTPPYIPHVPRKRASPATRIAVYAAQEGRCFYCQRPLLPLEVWKRGSRDGHSVIDEMDFSQRHNAADTGIPELDHKILVARGGSHEQENLCFACRKCNQLKGIRTVEEFACYPNDSISRLPMDVGSIAVGIALEARGYDQFDVGLPTLKALERLVSIGQGAR